MSGWSFITFFIQEKTLAHYLHTMENNLLVVIADI